MIREWLYSPCGDDAGRTLIESLDSSMMGSVKRKNQSSSVDDRGSVFLRTRWEERELVDQALGLTAAFALAPLVNKQSPGDDGFLGFLLRCALGAPETSNSDMRETSTRKRATRSQLRALHALTIVAPPAVVQGALSALLPIFLVIHCVWCHLRHEFRIEYSTCEF